MLDWLLTHTPLLYFTQSLWRDEAFSILVAQRPLLWIIQSATFEPPVYYTLLHFWIKLFGTSEIAVRSLSLLGFVLATIVVIAWSEKLFKKSWLSMLLPLLFFINPMLLYYAFEIRTYGWYIFFATLSMYAYTERRWRLYVLATILGFYTHSYFLIVPFVQVMHWALTKKISSKSLHDPFFRASIINGLFILPWIIRIAGSFGKFKDSWYFPVDLHLIRSVLGNMFVGYEGTPWYFWDYTAALSVFLLLLFITALRTRESKQIVLYFVLAVILPLALVIGISTVKPLFVNRYLIPVTIAEIILAVFAISTIRRRVYQYVLGSVLVLFCVGFNMWYPKEHPKIDIRHNVMEINALRGHRDVILAGSPLVLFETIYYSSDPQAVYLYNPTGAPFPWYIGDVVFDSNRQAFDLPPYPMRAFLIHEDGSYDVMYRTSPTI